MELRLCIDLVRGNPGENQLFAPGKVNVALPNPSSVTTTSAAVTSPPIRNRRLGR